MSRAASDHLLVVALDASADGCGARVLERLRGSGLRPFGMGGSRMRAAGLEALAEGEALSAVGISEALRGVWAARRALRLLVREAAARRPAAAILLAAPGLNLRLARRLGALGVPVVYYIAPQAWAWRGGRVRQLRRRVLRLCVVLPFEEEFFRSQGVPAEYVGHPLTEEEFPPADGRPERVVLLPGSRRREIERLAGPLLGAARLLSLGHPGLRFQLSLAPGADPAWLGRSAAETGFPWELDRRGARACLPGARLALCASGTVTLEAAMAGVPQVVTYRLSRLSYAILKLMARVKQVSLVNLLLGRPLVPELLQRHARAEALAKAAEPLLEEGPARQRVLDGYRELKGLLGERRPSRRVAEVVLEAAGRK